jgi:ribosome-associated toxin RatA of RatAB toxin-antitoxin module
VSLRWWTLVPVKRENPRSASAITCKADLLPMRTVERSALVPHSPEQMFALVQDIERYPQFVPWVARATVLSRTPAAVVGRLEMERAGLRETFTTRNLLQAPHRIQLELLEGPFKFLAGTWSFEPIAQRGTKISLLMRFEFANPFVSLLLSRSFEKSCNELVDAFVARARSMYAKQ